MSVNCLVRQVDKAGEILARAIDAGANRVGGVSFRIDPDKERTLHRDALALAVADAAKKADTIFRAAQNGMLGPDNALELLAIREEGVVMPPPVPVRAKSLAFAEAAAVPMEAGESAISASVTAEFRIVDRRP
jgi:uncharacterized protein YggE